MHTTYAQVNTTYLSILKSHQHHCTYFTPSKKNYCTIVISLHQLHSGFFIMYDNEGEYACVYDFYPIALYCSVSKSCNTKKWSVLLHGIHSLVTLKGTKEKSFPLHLISGKTHNTPLLQVLMKPQYLSYHETHLSATLTTSMHLSFDSNKQGKHWHRYVGDQKADVTLLTSGCSIAERSDWESSHCSRQRTGQTASKHT